MVDWLVQHFYARVGPRAVGVGLWSILGTRSHRIGSMPWIDVDAPEVAAFRRELLPERLGWLQIGTCLCNGSWLTAVCGHARRKLLFVLDESILPLRQDALTQFLDDVSRQAQAGSELILAFDAHTPLRPARPLQRSSALELAIPDSSGASTLIRYPRLRFVDEDSYPERTRTSFAGLNAVSRSRHGIDMPALAHLQVV